MPQILHDCVQKVMAQGKDESSAYAICNSQMGGSNFVDYSLNGQGNLFLKYFLADGSLARNTAVGDFSLNGAAIGSTAEQAIGLPFTILPSRDLSIFGDFHAWAPDEKATWDDHVAFARKYSPGHIVAVTPNSILGSSQLDQAGHFAVVQITDQRAKDAYLKNPDLIPKAVSPGIINLEAPNKVDIRNFKWTHLAAVPQGAYGDKATLYASCLGGDKCVNHLLAAGVAQKDKQTSYCPVGASENLEREKISSLVSSDGNSDIMSDTANTTPPVVAPQPAPQQGALTTTPTPTPQTQTQPILRLKNAVVPNTQQQQQQGQQGPAIDNKEFQKVQEQLAELQKAKQEADTRNKLQKIVPIDLFRINGKIDEAAYQKEIDKRVKEGWTEEYFPTLTEYYDMQGQILSLKAATGAVNPLGGSAFSVQGYQTPTQVPEPIGAGTQDAVTTNIRELLSRVLVMETA